MTREEYKAFEEKLKERGYRRYTSSVMTADHAYYKSFHKDDNPYEEDRGMYQIAFHAYDFSPFANRDAHFTKNPWSVSAEIQISRTIDERIDLSMHHSFLGLDVERIEAFAEELMQFVEPRIKPNRI